jgi:predicted nuclease of restriction endonuclease-like (RecB) superfamily
MEPLAPDSYSQFLAELKSRIQAAQLRASLAVNRELVLLYWQIGREILHRQEREKWGARDRRQLFFRFVLPQQEMLPNR